MSASKRKHALQRPSGAKTVARYCIEAWDAHVLSNICANDGGTELQRIRLRPSKPNCSKRAALTFKTPEP